MAIKNPDLRVMVDANILISGIIWPRWPFEVLQHAIKKDFHLILCEYAITQARVHFQRRFGKYLDQFDEFLTCTDFEIVDNPSKELVSQNNSLVRDPTDVPIAVAAIQSNVEILVSEDKDLTAKDASTKELHNQLQVMISGTFLREIMGWTSYELEIVHKRTWRDL